MSPIEGITQLLIRWGEGDQAALDELMPLVYNELHRLASNYTAHGHQPSISSTKPHEVSRSLKGGLSSCCFVWLRGEKSVNCDRARYTSAV